MVKILENIPIAAKTSYKIGGAARFYSEPESEEEIIELYQCALEREVSIFILGKGSNILVGDRGINGLVINLSARFSKVFWNDTTVTAQSGLPLDDLAAEAARRGCAGMEELSGIPGTVGGAVVMNAGAFGTDIAKTLKSVRVIRASTITTVSISAADLALGYRSSALKGSRDAVVSATFEFKAEKADDLLLLREQILNKRREKQPLDYPSCGSVFKRPTGNFAGTLIESSGLKGFSIGGATVSEKHANFIINTGNATADDVRRIIKQVQKTVYEKSKILLEPEVMFVGDF